MDSPDVGGHVALGHGSPALLTLHLHAQVHAAHVILQLGQESRSTSCIITYQHPILQGCGSGSGWDPDSVTLWIGSILGIRIRIQGRENEEISVENAL
jgi:hypothetical protein